MGTFIPLHQIYSQRDDYVIVAMTGITGRGCPVFADKMEERLTRWLDDGHISPLSKIEDIPSAIKQAEVFSVHCRKGFNLSRHYEPLKNIKYKNVLIMYILKDFFMKYADVHEFIPHLSDRLTNRFHPNYLEKKNYEVDNTFPEDNILILCYSQHCFPVI